MITIQEQRAETTRERDAELESLEEETKRLQGRLEEIGKEKQRGKGANTERAIPEAWEGGESEEEEEENPHDEKVRELEEEIANLRRVGKEEEDQKVKDGETMQRLRSERDAAERDRDQHAKELRVEKNAGKEWEGKMKRLQQELAEAGKSR